MSKPDNVTNEQILNEHAGIRLKEMAMMHAMYYTFNGFKEAIDHEKDERIKEIATQLCFLYGSNLILTNSSALIEGEYITSHHIGSLSKVKEIMLKKLRPNLIGIVDGFGIPDKFFRSALISGNPYEVHFPLCVELFETGPIELTEPLKVRIS